MEENKEVISDAEISDALNFRHQYYNMLDRYNLLEKNCNKLFNKVISNVSEEERLSALEKLKDIYLFEKVYYVKFEEGNTYSSKWAKSKDSTLLQGHQFRNKSKELYEDYEKLLSKVHHVVEKYDSSIDKIVEQKKNEYKKNVEQCFGK